jgi:hypothetical protein
LIDHQSISAVAASGSGSFQEWQHYYYYSADSGITVDLAQFIFNTLITIARAISPAGSLQ